jgi:hypothetical protein
MSTINGILKRANGKAPVKVPVVFVPRSNPQVEGTTLILSTRVTTYSSPSDGTFQIELEQGHYDVLIGEEENPIRITVPDDDATYNFVDLIDNPNVWDGPLDPQSVSDLKVLLGVPMVFRQQSAPGAPSTNVGIWIATDQDGDPIAVYYWNPLTQSWGNV